MGRVSRIEHNAGCTNSTSRNIITPKAQDRIKGGDFERNKQGFVEEKVPASSEAEGIVTPLASHSNKAARNRVKRRHLGDRVVDQTENAAVEQVCQEQTARAAFVETGADTDKEGCSNGAANGKQLDLAVAKTAVEAIGIAMNDLDGAYALVGGNVLDIYVAVACPFGLATLHDGGGGSVVGEEEKRVVVMMEEVEVRLTLKVIFSPRQIKDGMGKGPPRAKRCKRCSSTTKSQVIIKGRLGGG